MEDTFPLSPAQREIWLAQSQRPENSIFVIGECLLFPGCLDPARLQQAIHRLVAEVDALRLRIDPQHPRATIRATQPVTLAVHDYRETPEGQAQAETWMTAQMLEPIPFDGRPLIRFGLLLLSAERSILHCAYHHIAIDGLSVIIVIDRLAEIYSALIESREPPAAPPCSLAEQAAATADYLVSEAFQHDRHYWRDLITPTPPLTSLALRPDAPTGFKPGIRSSLTLPRASASELLVDGVTLTQALLAATALYVHRLTQLEDIVIALAVGGRIGRAMRRLPGNFANVVPVRLTVRPDDTFASVCQGMGQQLRGALRHQRYRMEDIERDQPTRCGAYFRRISVNAIPDERVIRFGDLEATNFDLSNDPTEELVISSFDFNHTRPLPLDFIGHPDHFDAAELRAHHHRFLLLLEQLAAPGARHQPVSALLLPEPTTVTSPHQDQLALAVKYRKNAALWDHRPLTPAQREAGVDVARPPLTLSLHVDGALDPIRLTRALDRLVARHDVLRLVLREVDGQTRQCVATHGNGRLQIETTPGSAAPQEIKPSMGDGPWITLRLSLHDTGVSQLHLELHPAVADPVAAYQLLHDLAALYEDRRLPPAASYAVHLVERAIATSGRRQRQAQLNWRQELANAEPFTLPWPAPLNQSAGLAIVQHTLSPDLSHQVRTAAQAAGANAPDVLLAAWLSLWCHYNDGRAGVLTLIARPSDADLPVGCHERQLPIHCNLTALPNLDALLTGVARQVAQVVTLGDETLDSGHEDTRPPNEIAFQANVAPSAPWSCGEATLRLNTRPQSTHRPALTLQVEQVASAPCSLVFYFHRDRVSHQDVTRLVAHYLHHLTALLAHPKRPPRTVPVRDAAESHLTSIAWNTSTTPLPAPTTLPALLRATVSRNPTAIALTDDHQSWTYAQLDHWSDQLARHLRQHGARPERIIGVLMDNSLTAVATIVGVLKSGAAYLPLDPANPPARLDYMLTDAHAAAVVTRQKWLPLVPTSFAATTIDLDQLNVAVDDPAGPLPLDLLPEHLAYIIYTSGTTGLPKGVMVPHQNWARVARWVSREFDYRASDRVLQFSSLGFDVSAEVMAATLIAGGTLVCASRLAMHPGPTLTRLLADQAINHLSLSPSALEVCPVSDLPDLRVIVLGGEACPPALAATWNQTARLINGYGPTETTILATCDRPLRTDPVTIGRPIDHYTTHLLDRPGQPVPLGVPGELYLGGYGVARGYLGRPGLTAERFVPDPFASQPGARLYRTGDRVRQLDDGRLEFCGRVDAQVKLRGFRIELGEIDAILRQVGGLDQLVVTVRTTQPGDPQLVAYVVGRVAVDALRAHAATHLPAYMVPAQFIRVPVLPLTPNGKPDLAALAALEPPSPTPVGTPHVPFAPTTTSPSLVATVAAIWREVLGHDPAGADTNFFEAGGNSLLLVGVQEKLGRALDRDIPILDLFNHPTIRSLAQHLQPTDARVAPAAPAAPATSSPTHPATATDDDIAIIGWAGRFPGAPDIEAYWQLLCDGREGITTYDESTLRAAGCADSLLADPHYVKRFGALEGVGNFDAEFFGFSPREAAVMDPQHRLFFESAWHALENAGYDPARYPDRIGVFAGCGANTYRAGFSGRQLLEHADAYLISLGNDKDFVPTRTSYKLDLRGPSVSVNTACSTSLVALHLGRQALLRGECEMVLIGGVTVLTGDATGYRFNPNGIFSPDGHCRAFADDAHGTVPASGVGAVVLKPLAAALRDRDTIHAVVQGSAINNDGAVKVGFTAPSVSGQVDVVRQALRDAGLTADQIGYMEAHGTGTELGDPIEVEALSTAFATDTTRTGYCLIGSAKSNLGHTDTAAGVASLIKAALSLSREYIPPSLHCATPNRRIDFSRSPFRPAATGEAWPRTATPRFAGISSFGIGGTNAHVILREPPAPLPARPPAAAGTPHLLVLSARNRTALDEQTAQLAAHLERHPDLYLPDAAFTLAQGRRTFRHRHFVVGRDAPELAHQLRSPSGTGARSAPTAQPASAIAFMFPGQGSQYPGMAADLYQTDPNFRKAVDEGCEPLRPLLGQDLRTVLWPTAGTAPDPSLHQTRFAQPALFVIQHALAQVWMARGVEPAALIGHSVGELAAAVLAGVMDYADALKFVARRADLLQHLPPGAMAAVPLGLAALTPLLGSGVELAAYNGVDRCVVTGDFAAMDAFQVRLRERDVRAIRLHTSHAFHSAMVEPAVAPLVELARTFTLRPPTIPIISNESGTWLSAADAVDPAYWGRHLRQPVRFHDGLSTLLAQDDHTWALVEVGPGRTLSALAERHPARERAAVVLSSLPDERDKTTDAIHLLSAVGRLWVQGYDFDWDRFYAAAKPHRIPLPPYPFQRQRYWIESGEGTAGASPTPTPRMEIPSATPATAAATEVSDPPTSDAEIALAALWSDVLGVSALNRQDNFFTLGGDSLLGVQLFGRIKESFAVQLDLRVLFDAPTVAALALVIEDRILSEIEQLPEE